MADLSVWRIWLLHAEMWQGDCDVVVARSAEEAHELTHCTEASQVCPTTCFEIPIDLDPHEFHSRPMRLRRKAG